MFKIDTKSNEAISIDSKTFKELGFSERNNLQEWIDKNTDILGEELLIIQKEYAGFEDTNERLDLLAIDLDGNLVIIENKLDDSGRDVTWQALKYVSYCSTLTKDEVIEIYQKYLGSEKDAKEEICNFLKLDDIDEVSLNEGDQRMILVAANYRKEVTSTVMWLLDHGIKIKCIKVTPYKFEGNIFLDTEQIIPVKEAEEYLIKHANKKQLEASNSKNEYKKKLYTKFWTKVLNELNQKTTWFRNVSPGGYQYLGTRGFNFAITNNSARAELYIYKESKEYNEAIFDLLFENKKEIEEKVESSLKWERLDSKRACRISSSMDIDFFNENSWEEIINFLVPTMLKLIDVIETEYQEAIVKARDSLK